ncbi:putative zinc finger protein [Orchesella cincta]|uniref:Putative zinc finger protein n=1 Tax=Orchesella cincta TaxID=48709 RepID=A0A1D2N2T6_ORCCI|nr:putative zinc finger protein [Orchesella cincta]
MSNGFKNRMKGRGDESGSDVEFHPVRPETERRWNLRKRRTRASRAEKNDDESDEDFTPGVLPPLRAPKGSKAQRILYDDSEKQFKCNMCNKRFRMERTLKRHLGEVHSLFLQHKCPHCDLKFKKQTDLKIHKRKAHLPANFKMGDQLPYKGIVTPCTVCQKVFPSRIKMTKHRKTHNLMESHTCEICGKTVVGLFRIQFHMKTHNRPDKPFHCKKCPRSFATQDGLDMHLKLHDNPDWVPWVRKKPKKTSPSSRPDGPYKCEEPNCGKSFVKPYNLQVHMALHATNFSCAVCEQVFEKVRDIRRHLNKLHETENKVHFCVHCDKAYTIEQSFDIHKKVAHPSKGKIPCDEDYCTEEFDDADLLREHLKTHLVGGESQATSTENADDKTEVAAANNNSNTLLTTGNLNIETSEENLTNEELELIKPGIYTCERCNWSFCKKLSLTLHKLVHTPKNAKKLYPCVLCEGKAFAMVDSLQTHYNRLHGPKLKPYLCLQCGVRFHRKESFTLHGQTHIDRASSSSFECETCKKKFRDSVALKRHIRLTHETGQKCDQCDEKFAGKLPLMYHKHEKHGMEKPVKCEVEGCGKGFFNQYQLSMHRTCHNDGKFNCPMCPKVFRRSHNLADHILVHKQEKNHICHFCGKAFVKKSSLNIHLVIHTQDKQFKCPHCPKAFCRKFSRDCHIRTHTKETPFTCHICGRQFGQYTSMRNHLKVHMKLNSTEVVRRPFKKTIGVGKPLVEKSDEPAENSIAATEEVQDNSEPKFEVPTASGIIHEALQAAFQDINMDLESSITVKEDDVASAAPAIVEDQKPANEDAESEESEVEAPVVKRKRGRPRKSKDFICGICGKAFVREKPYNAHVERHLNDAGQSNTKAVEPAQPDSRHVNISMPELTPSPAQMLSASHSNTHQNTAISQAPNVLPAYVPPQYPVASTTTTRKSSRKVSNNKAPGSRLARIVEDVIEAATNKSGSAYTNVVTSSPTNVIQNHYHHEPNHHQHHNLQQSHHIQSPPPPHHLSQPNSERSTPTGSNHNTPSPVPTTTIPTSTVFPSTSFLSPFLYANPYLLPLQPQQQGEQLQLGSDTSFQGQAFPGYTNAVQNRQQPQQQQQFQYQHNQVQYQQNASHGSPNTMPQDLSKTSYSVFYANPR